MRIISGKAKGTKLLTLEGMETRPTLDRVKESIFNIIQNEIEDSIFLDLFAGSGAIGLEAASRGAKKVLLCDKSKEAIKIISRNIEKTHMQDKTQYFQLDFKDMLIKQTDEYKFDIIYIDPPYSSNFAIDSIKIILERHLLNEKNNKSIIIVETDRVEQFLNGIINLEINIVDKRKYGRATIVILKL